MSAPLPPLSQAIRWIATFALGAAGGWLAARIGAPLPWLIGPLLVSGALAASGARVLGAAPSFPPRLRLLCVPVIGVLIGSSFTPETLGAAAAWWPGLIAVALFVPAALAVNYRLLRRVGGLDPATAYFGGMPGGLMESIELGAEHGADMRALTVLQFARIALVVTFVPLAFAALEGRAVGSAAGAAAPGSGAPFDVPEALVLIVCGALGFFGGRRLRLPAGPLTGPLLASGAAHALGLTAAAPPAAVVALAQIIIGVTLGLRFVGLTGAEFRRWFALAGLAVLSSIGVGALFAAAAAALGVAPFEIMALCFAPGGVVEMGLIALSLEASPVLVTTHHLVRIAAAVVTAAKGWRFAAPQRPPPRPSAR